MIIIKSNRDRERVELKLKKLIGNRGGEEVERREEILALSLL